MPLIRRCRPEKSWEVLPDHANELFLPQRELRAVPIGSLTISAPHLRPLCLFSSFQRTRHVNHQLPKEENEKSKGTFSPRSPPPRTELRGQAQAWRRPHRTPSCGPGGHRVVRPAQHPQAGDGGYGEQAPEEGQEVCGQLNEPCQPISVLPDQGPGECVEPGGTTSP